MAPKQKKRVSFSAGIETPDDLLSLPAVYRHPDPVLRRFVVSLLASNTSRGFPSQIDLLWMAYV